MTPNETQSLTDGFHLLIDALKLNDINTIYGVLVHPGLPTSGGWLRPKVCGFCRSGTSSCQYAASVAGYLTRKRFCGFALPFRQSVFEWSDGPCKRNNELFSNDFN